MTKYWVPSFSVSRVPLFLLLLSFLFFAIGSYLQKSKMPDKGMSGRCTAADCLHVNRTVSTGRKDFENNSLALYDYFLLFL